MASKLEDSQLDTRVPKYGGSQEMELKNFLSHTLNTLNKEWASRSLSHATHS